MILKKEQCERAIDDAVIGLAVLSLAEEEGKKLWAENEQLKSTKEFILPDKIAHKLKKEIKKSEKKRSLLRLAGRGYPVLCKIAIVFLLLSTTFYMAFAASASLRRTLYELMLSQEKRYTQISTSHAYLENFCNNSAYEPLERAFGLTYIPFSYNLGEHEVSEQFADINYVSEIQNHQFTFYQNATGASQLRIDTENAELVESIYLGDSEAIVVEKEGMTTISWQIGATIIMLSGDCDREVLIEVAHSVKLMW